MAKNVSDMDDRDLEKVITATLGSDIADFKLGGKLRNLAKVIGKLIERAYDEGVNVEPPRKTYY